MLHMKTIAEIRRANLEKLIQEHDTQNRVAELCGSSAVYLSQIRNRAKDAKTGKPRQMGDDLARQLEKGCGKPPGWMDNLSDQDAARPGGGGDSKGHTMDDAGKERAVYRMTPKQDSRLEALLAEWAKLDDGGKDDLIAAVRMFIAGRRPHQNGQALSVAG